MDYLRLIEADKNTEELESAVDRLIVRMHHNKRFHYCMERPDQMRGMTIKPPQWKFSEGGKFSLISESYDAAGVAQKHTVSMVSNAYHDFIERPDVLKLEQVALKIGAYQGLYEAFANDPTYKDMVNIRDKIADVGHALSQIRQDVHQRITESRSPAGMNLNHFNRIENAAAAAYRKGISEMLDPKRSLGFQR